MKSDELLQNLKIAFDHLNLHIFKKSLIQVCFAFSSKQKSPIKFLYDINTIVIGNSALRMEKMDFLNFLIHEMIHISNFQNDIKDVSANEYHTQKYFLKIALEIGLYVAKHKNQGWAITSFEEIQNYDFVCTPNLSQKDYLNSVFQSCPIQSFDQYDNGLQIIKKKSKPREYLLKYTCKCDGPHNSIRSGRKSLDISCNKCGSQFVCKSEIRKNFR